MALDLTQLKARLPTLAAEKGLPADLLPRASQEARARGLTFSAALLHLGVDERVVLELMCAAAGLQLLNALPPPEPHVGGAFNADQCRALHVVPLAKEPGGYLLACCDPLVANSKDVQAMPPHRLVVASRAQVASALDRVFGHVDRTVIRKTSDDTGLPKVLGGFRRLDKLGEGGMAVVFRAEELAKGRPAALKVMLPHLANDKEFVRRFLQEAHASQRLSHANVVAVYGSGEDQGIPYIASELMDGGTVEQLLAKTGAMPTPLALEIFMQALAGVAAAHQEGIIHRDLKPANLLLSSSGRVKVGDFGIAKMMGAAKLTQTGIAIGTPAYMSPEQATGGTLTPASDLFSMGLILYELLSGENPHNAGSATAAIHRLLSGKLPPILRVAPTVPPEVENLLHGLVAKDPQRRPGSAAEWLPALEKMLVPWRQPSTAGGAPVPSLVARALVDPIKTCEDVCAQEAARLFAEASPLMSAEGPPRRRAAFLLYRAWLLAPNHVEVAKAFRSVSTAEKLDFSDKKSPKIAELEASFQTSPEALGVLQQLGNLYKLEGNAWKAAFYLRHYLRIRPLDGYVKGQLAQLTGAQVTPSMEFAAAPDEARTEPAKRPAAPSAVNQDFVEYHPGEEHSALSLVPVTLWRLHGKKVLIGGVVLLLGGLVFSSLLSALDASVAPVTAPRQTPAYEPPPTTPRDEGSELVDSADQALRAGNAAGAFRLLQTFEAQYPSHERRHEVLLLRAEAHLELDNLPNAQLDASQVVAQLPPNAPLRQRAERVLREVSRKAEARRPRHTRPPDGEEEGELPGGPRPPVPLRPF